MFAIRRCRLFSSVKAYNESKNYYKTLNITQTASALDIKKAFKELAKKYHPDYNKGKEQLFKEVNQAYQVLSDTKVKTQYDQVRRSTSSSRSQRGSYQYESASQDNSKAYSQSPNQKNQYRGYEKSKGWNDMNFRQQFMYDLHRQQQSEYQRKSQTKGDRHERQFRQRMKNTQNSKEHIRQYTEEMKNKQAEVRRQFEQEQRRQRQQEQQQFSKYKDENVHDIGDKFQKKMNNFAEGIANGVKDALKVGEQIKDFWEKFKKSNKK